jgi:hypothetical protein
MDSNFDKFQNETDLLAQTLSRLPEPGACARPPGR